MSSILCTPPPLNPQHTFHTALHTCVPVNYCSVISGCEQISDYVPAIRQHSESGVHSEFQQFGNILILFLSPSAERAAFTIPVASGTTRRTGKILG